MVGHVTDQGGVFKMSKISFTAGRVADFVCPEGKQQVFLWDERAPGLALRATQGGAKSYIFQGKLHGKTLRLTIGNVKIWTVADAQAEARRLQILLDQGLDPREKMAEQRAATEAKQAEVKFKAARVMDAWQAYINHCSKRWSERHLADHQNLVKAPGIPHKRGKGETVAGVLYELVQMSMGAITAVVVTDWVRRESEKRASKTRHGYVLFKTFWRWCAERPEYAPYIQQDALEGKDLRAEVPKQKAKGFDVLERGQLQPWFAAVRGLSNPVASVYLQALLLTGARREEMAGLRWADVDFKWGAMWLKDKVEEDGRKLPLTPFLSQLLASLPRRNEWVFSSPTSESGRFVEPRIAHNRALDVAGLPHVTLHGLRRTFASLAEWIEMPDGIVAQIMGHKPNATAERHYIRRPLELLAVWHGKYEAWILEQAGVQFSISEKHERLHAVK